MKMTIDKNLVIFGIATVAVMVTLKLIPKEKKRKIKESAKEVYKDTVSAITEGTCKAVMDDRCLYRGHVVYFGPRGGMYYYSPYGNKIYI